MIPKIPHRIARHIAQTLAANSEPATIKYRTLPGGTPSGFNPNDQATYPAQNSFTDVTATIPAIIHRIAPDSSAARANTELRVGDIILDVPGDALDLGDDLANAIAALGQGKEGGYYEIHAIIDGQRYIPKNVGKRLMQSWDAHLGGKGTTRTFILQPAQ